ncbi:MAG: methylthioribose-1-phosphate isomerase [Myxococcota bacterium]
MSDTAIRPIRRDSAGDVIMLDQRKLPFEEVYVTLTSAQAVADAIRAMIIRGAPAIGVSAAMGLALGARDIGRNVDFSKAFAALCEVMAESRPTAVNLFWAIARMKALVASLETQGVPRDGWVARLDVEAQAIFDEDIAMNRAIGAHGAALLPDDVRILTHCNTGSLATAGYGTALGVIRAAVEAGKRVKVYADETRPYLQGSRLTAWELQREGIDVTVIADSAAGHLIQRGFIDVAIVGADRITANGDAANKIGTYTVSVLCDRHDVPFYVAAPSSTIDLSLPDGSVIPIEERPQNEVTSVFGHPIAPPGVPALNPSFDVTPGELIRAIVTEHGAARAPFVSSLPNHV